MVGVEAERRRRRGRAPGGLLGDHLREGARCNPARPPKSARRGALRWRAAPRQTAREEVARSRCERSCRQRTKRAPHRAGEPRGCAASRRAARHRPAMRSGQSILPRGARVRRDLLRSIMGKLMLLKRSCRAAPCSSRRPPHRSARRPERGGGARARQQTGGRSKRSGGERTGRGGGAARRAAAARAAEEAARRLQRGRRGAAEGRLRLRLKCKVRDEHGAGVRTQIPVLCALARRRGRRQRAARRPAGRRGACAPPVGTAREEPAEGRDTSVARPRHRPATALATSTAVAAGLLVICHGGRERGAGLMPGGWEG
jgi:hypothetical protein